MIRIKTIWADTSEELDQRCNRFLFDLADEDVLEVNYSTTRNNYGEDGWKSRHNVVIVYQFRDK